MYVFIDFENGPLNSIKSVRFFWFQCLTVLSKNICRYTKK